MKIKLIVGLGNPGAPYRQTYHNVGFHFADRAAEILTSENKSAFQKAKSGLFESLPTDGFVLIKPLTFMNESGKAVKEAVKKLGAAPAEILAVHDDSDIEIGKYKISFGRGSAGHRGVQSLIEHLKTKNFWRLRIGIRPKNSKLKAADFVLKKTTPTHGRIIEAVFGKALKEIAGKTAKKQKTA